LTRALSERLQPGKKRVKGGKQKNNESAILEEMGKIEKKEKKLKNGRRKTMFTGLKEKRKVEAF